MVGILVFILGEKTGHLSYCECESMRILIRFALFNESLQ